MRSTDPSGPKREAENQALCREVNERIEEVADALEVDSDIEFLCECGAGSCARTIRVARSQYEAVRANPRRFFVLPGHERLTAERVVEVHGDFLVVETFGEAAEVAEASSPRP